jgi:hypothetical protein
MLSLLRQGYDDLQGQWKSSASVAVGDAGVVQVVSVEAGVVGSTLASLQTFP